MLFILKAHSAAFPLPQGWKSLVQSIATAAAFQNHWRAVHITQYVQYGLVFTMPQMVLSAKGVNLLIDCRIALQIPWKESHVGAFTANTPRLTCILLTPMPLIEESPISAMNFRMAGRRVS